MYLKNLRIVSIALVLALLCIFAVPIQVSAITHPYGSSTPPSSFYSFDEANIWKDMSGNDNHLVPGTTAPVTTTGKKNRGLSFQNTAIKANNSSSLNFGTGDFSIAFWIKTSDASGRLFNKRNSANVGYDVEIYGGYVLLQISDPQYGFFNYYSYNMTKINDSKWHYVAITVDRDSTSGVKIYIDNKLEASMNATYRMGNITNTADLSIGENFIGVLDEARIYDRVISQAEMDNLYSNYFKSVDLSFDNYYDETSGNGNSSFCALNNDYFTNAVKNKGLIFTGDQDKLTIPKNPTLDFGTEDFTVSFWIKTTKKNFMLFDKSAPIYDGYQFCVYNGALQVDFSGNGYGTGIYVSDGSWHLVTLSVARNSSNGFRVFIDRTIKIAWNPINIVNKNISSTADLIIGDSQSGTDDMKFEGMLDEIAFYNRAMSDTEIYEMYDTYTIPSDMMFGDNKSVSMGDSQTLVVSRFGAPSRIDTSEYGFSWYIYNQDYSNYVQIGIKDGKVVAYHSNAKNFVFKNNVKLGSTAAEVENILGSPYTGGGIIIGASYECVKYRDSSSEYRVYYDVHNNNLVSAVYVVDINILKTPVTYTSSVSSSSEREVFDMANAFRVSKGLTPFIWSDAVATTARNHSIDMYQRNFYSHTNPDGKSPFQRMTDAGITYKTAGENIYLSPSNAIEAHEGWIASFGHRRNILDSFTYLGVGVHLVAPYQTYYTQNFYTPF